MSKRKCPSSQCPESVFQPGSQCVLCVTLPRQGVHLLAKHSGPLTDDMALPTLTHLPYHSSSLPLTPPNFPSLHLTHLTPSQYSTNILTPTHTSVFFSHSSSLILTTTHSSSLSSSQCHPNEHHPLWVGWLLVGACSAAHPSLGTEPQSNFLYLAFLRPVKQLHNSAHDCGIQHNICWPSISSNFPWFPSVAY